MKSLKEMNLKSNRFLAFLFFMAIIASSSITYVLAVGTNTFTISSGLYPGAPTYTIYQSGSTYYAKTAWGAIATSGTNITTLVNAIITSGENIYFKSGTYIFDHSIRIINKENITMSGEGLNTIFGITTNTQNVISIIKSSNIRITNIAVIGLGGNGNTAITGNGIYVEESNYVKIDHCLVTNHYRQGIYITTTAGSPYESSNYVVIEGNQIHSNGESGIRINEGVGHQILNNYLDNNYNDAIVGVLFSDSKICGNFVNYTIQDNALYFDDIKRVEISHNTILWADDGGIQILAGSGSSIIHDILINDNVIMFSRGSAIYLGNHFNGAYFKRAVISGNTISNCGDGTDSGIHVSNATYYIDITDNVIYDEGQAYTYYGIRLDNQADYIGVFNNIAAGMVAGGSGIKVLDSAATHISIHNNYNASAGWLD